MVNDTFSTEHLLTPRPVKNVKAAVARKMKLGDIQIMELYSILYQYTLIKI